MYKLVERWTSVNVGPHSAGADWRTDFLIKLAVASFWWLQLRRQFWDQISASLQQCSSRQDKGVASMFIRNSWKHLNGNAIRRAGSVVGNLWAGGCWLAGSGIPIPERRQRLKKTVLLPAPLLLLLLLLRLLLLILPLLWQLLPLPIIATSDFTCANTAFHILLLLLVSHLWNDMFNVELSDI